MYKNLIFDFGNVLVRFDPEIISGGYGLSSDEQALICKVVFDRLYWSRLDDGTLEEDECIRLFLRRLPEELHAVSVEIFRNWAHRLPPIDGMEALVLEMKNRGLGLYIMSDISRGFAENHSFIPVLSHFDGFVFSGITGITKDYKEAFENALARFSMSAGETLFIDDKGSNLFHAKEAGIDGYLFDGDAAKLRGYLLSHTAPKN